MESQGNNVLSPSQAVQEQMSQSKHDAPNDSGSAANRKREGKFKGNDNDSSRNKKRRRKDMGRNEWSRESAGKRDWNERSPRDILDTKSDTENVDKEPRRPKRKVAVLMGYCGTGYKGMQVNGDEKTIERDLFNAFVAAGAISKANSNDPKKSSLIRCARTDKGVHAAGNMISLKLIVEDPDIVEKINQHLPPQIRVWGIERTTGSFSCYNMCDSRVYEYLLPTHALLPPHPQTYLGRKMDGMAKETGHWDDLRERQAEVSHFWDEAEERFIKPAVKSLDPSMRKAALAAVFQASESESTPEVEMATRDSPPLDQLGNSSAVPDQPTTFDAGVRKIKSAYLEAKKGYRISPARLERLREALAIYTGTHNFHNYTIQKQYRDPSAKRHIKSFTADEPKVNGNTEWVSLKVQGQSFMMHQIRKMVSMAVLVVRMGCSLDLVRDSFGATKFNIPKAPGLGLLLERPVFDGYNKLAVEKFQRETIDFDKFKQEILGFKHKHIYEHISQEEDKLNEFHAFFNHIDNYAGGQWLHFTSAGSGPGPNSVAEQGGKDKDIVMTQSPGRAISGETLADDAASQIDQEMLAGEVPEEDN